ncbi:MAG: hypothetical protein EOP00_03145 [Pedobacter sp.]|nr:MAG: hypothetical protein EOP00_03145 [Pedobacter sp.]
MLKKNYLLIFASICLFYACNGNKKSASYQDTTDIDSPKISTSTVKVTGDSLSITDAESLTKSIYDTVKNEPQFDNPTDTMTRDNAILKYLEDKSGKYYIYVVENRGPFAGVAVGWCDVFIFKKTAESWILNDFTLNAGGGGMYGNSGSLEKLVKMGDDFTGIVLSAGQTHMGNNFSDDVVGFRNGKLVKGFSISTLHDYGDGAGDDYKLTVCESNKYHFEKNNKETYDLVIEKYNCLNGDKLIDSAVITYNNGYKIPDRFLFEG